MSLTRIKDLDLKILEEMDDRTLLSFCSTHQRGKELCSNELFWKKRFIKQYGRFEKNKDRTWKDFYLGVTYYLDKYSLNEGLRKAAGSSGKNLDLIKFLIARGASDFSGGMGEATKGNYPHLIAFFISKGADPNVGLELAALLGNEDLVDFYLARGAWRVNWGLYGAARGGYTRLVYFFIDRGANDWTNALKEATIGRHDDLVRFFVSKGGNLETLYALSFFDPNLQEYLKKFMKRY